MLRIALRTAHIGAAGLILGAAHLGAEDRLGPGVWMTLLLTGFGILADDAYKWREHLWRMGQLWMLLAKLALLGAGFAHRPLLLPMLWAVLVLGSVVSHAPGSVRHFELWGRDRPAPE